MSSEGDSAPRSRAARRVLPGLAVTAVGVLLALGLHALVPAIGVLTWSVLLGAVAANVDLLRPGTAPGLRVASRQLLRLGVVLLGFSLSLVSIADLGLPVISLVIGTLVVTLVATTWAGTAMGLGRPRSLLIGTGFAICGASAIAAMEATAEADEDDVAAAVAMVTICGSAAMIAVPLLQLPLGLSDEQLGVWAGASVHEVGQVVAAAGPAGAAAVAIAVVVKLTRVLLLAPVVTAVSLMRRHSAASASTGVSGTRPPIVPLFVVGFLGCVVLRTVDVVPHDALTVIGHLQTAGLAAAMFGLGTGVRLALLLRSGGPALALGALSTVVVAGVSLVGVQWLA